MHFFEDKKLITKGENSFNSGHVRQAQFDKELGILRAEVLASMKKKTYKVEVYTNLNGIIKSTCNCPRGLDICHHMCAVAFFGHYNISVTDLSCSWSVKKDTGELVQTAEELFPPSTQMASFKAIQEAVTEQHLNSFYKSIKEFGPTGIAWLLSPEPEVKPSELQIPNVEALLFSKEYHDATNKKLFLIEKFKVSIDNILYVNQLTIGQGDNPLWLIAKKNRLTASNFGKILNACRRNKYPPSLFKTLAGMYIKKMLEKVSINMFRYLQSRWY
ncbi:hypothetical protein RI129_007757 [Pyrocoelia pectoralis]|uniref:SWIM-type domain-containing protein n=1 Tax=Pyrocoelia pectoralis TaxID=417401 RepID=A0AAN7ZIS6_9COLE